jgi:hypothetical protein
MPLYVIERTFAEQLELTSDDVTLIEDVNADEGVRWVFSFLSADRHRTYCLYEAPSPRSARQCPSWPAGSATGPPRSGARPRRA